MSECGCCGRELIGKRPEARYCSVICAKAARDEALKRGDKLRLRHVELRKEIARYSTKEGRAVLADVIRNMDPELRGIKIRHLLTAAKGQGKGRAEEVLERIGLANRLRLNDLTEREREVLASAVEKQVFVDEHGFARAAA